LFAELGWQVELASEEQDGNHSGAR
jgi:hypothetical protein